MKALCWTLTLACFLLLLGPGPGHAARRHRRAKKARAARHLPLKAAVIITETADQPQATLNTLRSLLETELEGNKVLVSRKTIPRRLLASPRRLATYARKNRVNRIFELQLMPMGKKLVVTLADSAKEGRRFREAFSAKLSAGRVEDLDALIPVLVEAVIARKSPRPQVLSVRTEVQPVTVRAEAETEPAPASPNAPAHERQPYGEFLWGFSLEPGTFLREAAGLYGASARLLYQLKARPIRFGAELAGAWGDGRLLEAGVQAQYIFLPGDISPVAGAGFGFTMLNDAGGASGAGVAFSLSAGAQFSQLRWTKLVAEFEVVLPAFTVERQDPELDNGILNVVRHARWSPAGIFKLGCLF
jgi:hypothetical protein